MKQPCSLTLFFFSRKTPKYNARLMCTLMDVQFKAVITTFCSFTLCVFCSSLILSCMSNKKIKNKNTIWNVLPFGTGMQVDQWHFENSIWFKAPVIYEGMLNTYLKCLLYKSRITLKILGFHYLTYITEHSSEENFKKDFESTH